MDIYSKIRTLALLDPTMQAYFVTGGIPRWFKQRLDPGYITRGSCVRVKRVSTAYGYTNAPTGLMNLNQPRMQVEVLDFDSTRAQAAATALINFLGTVSFAVTNDFDSPPTSAPNSPNFLLNRLSGMEATVEPPGQVFVEILEFRLFNLEN